MKKRNMFLWVATLCAVVLLAACGGMTKSKEDELTKQARASLNKLYATSPDAKKLKGHAKGILVFPDILKAGLLVGGSGGNGVLFAPDGSVMGYYNASTLSFGLQAGAQNYSEAMFLVTQDALDYLKKSDGWAIGVGPSIVVMDQGTAADLTSTTLQSDVYAFIYSQQGLMGGIGIQGQKITKYDPAKY